MPTMKVSFTAKFDMPVPGEIAQEIARAMDTGSSALGKVHGIGILRSYAANTWAADISLLEAKQLVEEIWIYRHNL